MTQTLLKLQSSDMAIAKEYCDLRGYTNTYGNPLTKGQIAFSVFKSFIEDEVKPYMADVNKKKASGFDTLGLLQEKEIVLEGDK